MRDDDFKMLPVKFYRKPLLEKVVLKLFTFNAFEGFKSSPGLHRVKNEQIHCVMWYIDTEPSELTFVTLASNDLSVTLTILLYLWKPEWRTRRRCVTWRSFSAFSFTISVLLGTFIDAWARDFKGLLIISIGFSCQREYSQLPLRRTPLGPAVSVRLREMSVL